MSYFQSFIISLYLPGKVAKLRFQQMKNTLIYFFALMLFSSIPGAVQYITSAQTESANPVSLTVYVFIYYVLFAFIGFIIVSALAGIGLLIRNSAGRKSKLPYNQLWIMASYALTLPALLFSVTTILHQNSSGVLLFLSVLTTCILLRMIIAVPKPRQRR